MIVPPETQPGDASTSKILRAAIWVAIGALIAAAIVCVVMVLVGTANGIVPRAFLTIVLMVAFAGVALMDTYLAPRRPVWFALTSMVVWVVTLLIGAVMIWMPFPEFRPSDGASRFMSFLLIVLILQLAVLHVRLFMKAWQRHATTFTTAMFWITVILVGLLALMLVFPLMLSEWVRFHDLYWRLTVAVTILAAVGTALVPLVNALLAPRGQQPRPAAPAAGWPTYADRVTPLPVMPDGQPDWNAYYTGQPSVAPAPAAVASPVEAAAWPAPEPAPAIAPPSAPPVPPSAPAQAVSPVPPLPEPAQVDPRWPAPAMPAEGAGPQQPPAPTEPPAAPQP
ncbi:hypothetical protein [Microbacterium terrisoli]|uniref:hypothetical protein n=1 Tax=Microbacterium terrisoli TaxID=3242192 RepID=UPI0028041BDB|nr:hypothetical protein [Microbacterium protaetiae]